MYKRKTEIDWSSYIHLTINFTTSQLLSRDVSLSVLTDATAQVYTLRTLRGGFVRQQKVDLDAPIDLDVRSC